jgi:hypothetical protein
MASTAAADADGGVVRRRLRACVRACAASSHARLPARGRQRLDFRDLDLTEQDVGLQEGLRGFFFVESCRA